MTELLRTPLAETMGWSLLHHLWQATLLSLIAAGLLRLMRSQSANSRYLLSCAFLLLMALMPVATGWSVYDNPQASASSVRSAEAPRSLATEQSSPALRFVAAIEPSRLQWAQQRAETLLPWLVAGWVLGVVFLSARLLFGWSRIRSLRSSGTTVPQEWEERLGRIADAVGISRAITLLQSSRIEVPMVIGWIRPVLLVPVSALTGLTPRQLETIFAHELAHIHRHDYLVNLIQTLVETLFFYHPAVWWMSQRIRIERENCCDDLAVAACGNPVLYARALTTLEGLRMEPLALGAGGGSLKERVVRLIASSPSHCSERWIAGASIMTVIAAIIVAAPLSLMADRAPLIAANVSTSAFSAPPMFGIVETPRPDVTRTPAPGIPRSQEPITARPAPTPPPTPKAAVSPETVADRVADRPRVSEEKLLSPPQETRARAPYEVTIPASEIVFVTVSPTPSLAMMQQQAETPQPRARPKRRPGRDRWDGELSVDQLIALRTAGVEASFIVGLRRLGYGELSFDDLIQLRMNGVTPEFISGMNRLGLGHLSFTELIELRNAGVTPAYVSDLGAAGLNNLSVRDLVELRSGGVSAEFVRTLREAGVENLDAPSLIRLFQSGVTPDFIRELRRSTRRDVSRNERKDHEEDNGCSADPLAS